MGPNSAKEELNKSVKLVNKSLHTRQCVISPAVKWYHLNSSLELILASVQKGEEERERSLAVEDSSLDAESVCANVR